ncbi:hypothetical protein ECG_02285 [Echinococcus granulosus]|nr:hypothetical protein ECG_02285 [Echinococcus granulosus]
MDCASQHLKPKQHKIFLGSTAVIATVFCSHYNTDLMWVWDLAPPLGINHMNSDSIPISLVKSALLIRGHVALSPLLSRNCCVDVPLQSLVAPLKRLTAGLNSPHLVPVEKHGRDHYDITHHQQHCDTVLRYDLFGISMKPLLGYRGVISRPLKVP